MAKSRKPAAKEKCDFCGHENEKDYPLVEGSVRGPGDPVFICESCAQAALQAIENKARRSVSTTRKLSRVPSPKVLYEHLFSCALFRHS